MELLDMKRGAIKFLMALHIQDIVGKITDVHRHGLVLLQT